MLGDNQWCSPCCCCKLLPESGYSAGNDFSDKCWSVLMGSRGSGGITFSVPLQPTPVDVIGSAWRCFIVPQCDFAEVRIRATMKVTQAKEASMFAYVVLANQPGFISFPGLAAGWWVRSGAGFPTDWSGDRGYHANRIISVAGNTAPNGFPMFTEQPEKTPTFEPWPTAVGQTHEIDARFQYSSVPDKFGVGWSVQHGRISAAPEFFSMGLGEMYFGLFAQRHNSWLAGDNVVFSNFSVTLDYS